VGGRLYIDRTAFSRLLDSRRLGAKSTSNDA
jgi:hypothetical protein